MIISSNIINIFRYKNIVDLLKDKFELYKSTVKECPFYSERRCCCKNPCTNGDEYKKTRKELLDEINKQIKKVKKMEEE